MDFVMVQGTQMAFTSKDLTNESANKRNQKDFGSRADKKAIVTYELPPQSRGGTYAAQHGFIKSITYRDK